MMSGVGIRRCRFLMLVRGRRFLRGSASQAHAHQQRRAHCARSNVSNVHGRLLCFVTAGLQTRLIESARNG